MIDKGKKAILGVNVDAVDYEAKDLADQLIPVVRSGFFAEAGGAAAWAANLVRECREAMQAVLPFSPAEREFLDRTLDLGEVLPNLLTADTDMQGRIARQPLLQWKASHVRQHKKR